MEQMIRESLQNALHTLGITEAHFTIEHPADLDHGDYATNVAMVYAKSLNQNPKDLAQAIIEKLEQQSNPHVEKYTLAGPGFINIFLNNDYYKQLLQTIVTSGDNFGKGDLYHNKKILVEHSSPNLFKPFHIGHIMNNAIGESLVRIMKFSGAQVTTLSFPSDISLGVAKAIYVLLETQGPDFIPTEISVLGDAYVTGTRMYDENESIHGRVKEIADNLYANTESPELTIYNRCKAFNIAYFEETTKKLGSKFDAYIYESEAGVVGKDLVIKNTPLVFTESQGAVVYIPDESKKHINTAVFINSQGNPTYEAKDLGLLEMKFTTYQPDFSIFVTDSQQVQHFDVVLDAAEKIHSEWSKKSHHVPHGRMSFKGQKMSSRLGGVPLVTDILETVSAEIIERSDRSIDAKTVQDIAIGAVKLAILRARPGQHIDFDPEISLSFEGDSGPYLQYTCARITTLLEKAREQSMIPQIQLGAPVTELERILYRFPEVVASAAVAYAPSHVVTYLLEVARAFNSFYGSHKIIDTENREQSEHRLMIAQAVQVVIKNGLNVLGINAPDKM